MNLFQHINSMTIVELSWVGDSRSNIEIDDNRSACYENKVTEAKEKFDALIIIKILLNIN